MNALKLTKFLCSGFLFVSSVILMYQSVSDTSLLNRLDKDEIKLLEDTRKAISGILPNDRLQSIQVMSEDYISKLSRSIAIPAYSAYYGMLGLIGVQEYTSNFVGSGSEQYSYPADSAVMVGLLSGSDFKVSIDGVDVMYMYDTAVDMLEDLDKEILEMDNPTPVTVAALAASRTQEIASELDSISDRLKDSIEFNRKVKEYSGIVILLIAVLISFIDTKRDKNKLEVTKEI